MLRGTQIAIHPITIGGLVRERYLDGSRFARLSLENAFPCNLPERHPHDGYACLGFCSCLMMVHARCLPVVRPFASLLSPSFLPFPLRCSTSLCSL